MDKATYKKLVDTLIDLIDEGVYITDSEGVGIHYNKAMADIEKVDMGDVLGKKFHDAFPDFKMGESTMFNALSKNVSTHKKEQTYKNLYGKEITTINSTVPVIVGGKTVAAIEVAKDITNYKKLSDTILELQEGSIKPQSMVVKGIRRYTFSDLYGENEEFQAIVQRAKKAANNDASVFVYGETGTGKELFAQSIHFGGKRAQKPFLAQNCAAIPETLLEGMLFGTSKGAFTGAVDRAGLFEQANGGTLLLDELNAMPYELQGKLLRVLQESYIRRVGGSKDIPVDVRIIAAVNEPPASLIEKGILRKDLYYRLNVVNISIPPLRERLDDIPLLVDEFLRKHNEKYGKHLHSASDAALKKLQNYEYPGNVRELENIIEQAVSMAEEENVLTEKLLSMPNQGRKLRASDVAYDKNKPLDEYLAAVEARIIRAALVENAGNISKTADKLRIKRQTLQHKLKKYHIQE